MSGAKSLGFVVIGRNEGVRLAHCLASLKTTGAPVAYADSASSDDSLQVARTAGAIVVEVDPATPLNAARGRNAGLTALRSAHPGLEFVQFIDGDCILQPRWIEAATNYLRAHPRAAVVCGRRFEADPGGSTYNRICDEEWNTPIGLAQSCGGDAMFRLSALDDSGLFDPTLMAGEEPELCTRLRALGWEIWRLDQPMTKHDAAMTRLSQWLRRARRSGFGYAQAARATKGRRDQLYRAQLRSALFWALALPAIVLLAAAMFRDATIVLVLPAIYALQIARIAHRRGLGDGFSWRYGTLMVLAKFPEAIGIVSFVSRGGRTNSIEYKGTATR